MDRSCRRFMLQNDLLITGALVGSSGAILSYIMCRAMNARSGTSSSVARRDPAQSTGPAKPRRGAGDGRCDARCRLKASKSVIIIPGYGMAVARAQHACTN